MPGKRVKAMQPTLLLTGKSSGMNASETHIYLSISTYRETVRTSCVLNIFPSAEIFQTIS